MFPPGLTAQGITRAAGCCSRVAEVTPKVFSCRTRCQKQGLAGSAVPPSQACLPRSSAALTVD